MRAVSTMRIVGALGAVTLAAAALPGAAGAGGSSAAIGGGGVVQLHLGNDGDYVKLSQPADSGQTPSVQSIVSKKCLATLAVSPSLVSLTAEPGPPTGAVGLFDHGLGVKVAGEGLGTPCSRVDGLSQALRLSLTGSLAGKLIAFAELDVEGKSGVTVLARAYAGSTLVGSSQLPTGPLSDSGPDSADGDNFRWLIQPSLPFDTLVLSVDPSTPGGSFSLEGGADGTTPLPGGVGAALGTSDSILQLADFTGVLDCGQSSPTIGGGTTPKVDLTRGQNANCQKIPYLLRTDKTGAAQSVLLEKVLGNQVGANFTMTTVWQPEPAINPLPTTTIDYDGPGGNSPTPMVWCLGTTASPLPAPGQAWCLVSQQVAIVGGGNVQMTERYFGSGDPRWAR
jgi:hypothetical protein